MSELHTISWCKYHTCPTNGVQFIWIPPGVFYDFSCFDGKIQEPGGTLHTFYISLTILVDTGDSVRHPFGGNGIQCGGTLLIEGRII